MKFIGKQKINEWLFSATTLIQLANIHVCHDVMKLQDHETILECYRVIQSAFVTKGDKNNKSIGSRV